MRPDDVAIVFDGETASGERFGRELAKLRDSAPFGIECRPGGADLNSGVELRFDKPAVIGEARREDAGEASDALYADPVVCGEVAEAVGDEPVAIQLERSQHVRPVADDEVRAGIDDCVREFHDIAAILALKELVRERQLRCAFAFAAAVERDDHNVVMRGEVRDDLPGTRQIIELVRADVGRERHERQASTLDEPFRHISLAPGMPDACVIERAHARVPAGVAEILRVIVRQAHNVEAGVAQIGGVARGRAKHVAAPACHQWLNPCCRGRCRDTWCRRRSGRRVLDGRRLRWKGRCGLRRTGRPPALASRCGLAAFDGLAAVHQHTFEIAKRYVGCGENRRDRGKESHSVVIRENVLRIVRAHHDVANGSDRDALVGRRDRWRGHHRLGRGFDVPGWRRARCQQRRTCEQCSSSCADHTQSPTRITSPSTSAA